MVDKYLTGDDVNRNFEGLLLGKPYKLVTPCVVSVWDGAQTKIVDAQVMAISGTKASFKIIGSLNVVVGTYTVEADLTFDNSQGQKSVSETYEVVARHA